MVSIVTASNQRYLPRIKPYLQSLESFSPLENILIGVGCKPFAEYMQDVPHITEIELPSELNDGSPNETQSPQHGAFLSVFEGGDKDVIIFTDGDIKLQRRMSMPELAWLNGIADNVVYCGWNSGPGETLIQEGQRLFPKMSDGEISDRWGRIVYDAPCYNIGVFVANRATYRRIYAEYMRLWELACSTFGGPARQQWLVCYVLARYNITVDLMSYSFHMHGCYPLPNGAAFSETGDLLYKGEKVLFRHHV